MALEPPTEKGTKTAKAMAGELHVAGETPLVEGQVVEKLPPGFDQFSLTQAERKEYGLADHEEHQWVRNSKFWAQTEKSDRIREVLRTTPGAHVVQHPDGGGPVAIGDLVLVARPRFVGENKDADSRAVAEAFINRVEQREMQEDSDPYRGTLEELKARRDASHEQALAAGLVGPSSPTSGLPYDVAASRYSREEIREEEERFRRFGRHVTGSEGDRASRQDAADRAREAATKAGSRGRSYSIPGRPTSRSR